VPYQPVPDAEGSFFLKLDADLEDGLFKLEAFKYIYVLFYLHRQDKPYHTRVTPPWAKGKTVGLFASRSPQRPNPIGLSVVRIKRIEKNIIHISGIDALDGTPLLDVKPYSLDLDAKADANNGWRNEEKKETENA
jgi:tRNA-Thr(GGU) m(6)t(6)A37 methyltransferase TsaA